MLREQILYENTGLNRYVDLKLKINEQHKKLIDRAKPD